MGSRSLATETSRCWKSLHPRVLSSRRFPTNSETARTGKANWMDGTLWTSFDCSAGCASSRRTVCPAVPQPEDATLLTGTPRTDVSHAAARLRNGASLNFEVGRHGAEDPARDGVSSH